MSDHINAYLTFSVGQNTFGVHVEKVIEIQEYVQPKAVPESLAYMRGVIDHREEVVPLIDTGRKFNLGEINITPQSCIVVLEINKPDGSGLFNIGILVDAVSDVFESDPEKVKVIEDDFKPGYISATYKNDDTLVMILNTDKVFSETDIIAIDQIMSNIDKE